MKQEVSCELTTATEFGSRFAAEECTLEVPLESSAGGFVTVSLDNEAKMTEGVNMHGRQKDAIAFITTPNYRRNQKRKKELENFVANDLWGLCSMFVVFSTGGTYKRVMNIVKSIKYRSKLGKIAAAQTQVKIDSAKEFEKHWKDRIKSAMVPVKGGYPGMIRLTNDMIAGRIDGVIHLMDWNDVAAKPDTMVLRRQANVHDIPIACDVVTARVMISGWKSRWRGGVQIRNLCKPGGRKVEQEIVDSDARLRALEVEQSSIALIAHDGMKLEMCNFVAAYARKIADHDTILSTGTTGKWVKRTLEALKLGRHDIDKVICCLSGPKGGDVQIAWAVVQGKCRKVIFFQDPMVSHAHATDIMLFEQALLYRGIPRALAFNRETAVALLDA